MPRLRQVPKAPDNAPIVAQMYRSLFGDRDPVAEPGTATGTPGNWWTVFALVPDILEHCVRGFGLYRAPERTLDPVLREIGQTRAGWAVGSQFVFSQHCKVMRALGVSEEKIAAIPAWPSSPLFSEVERLLLAYTDCLVYDRGRVPDALFAALSRHLSDEQVLEFTYITSLYLMHAVMTKALRLEYDDRDEPIVEIAAPAGAAARDIGADISGPAGSAPR